MTKVENQPGHKLLAAVKSGRLPHGMLFAGPRESGQKNAALELAKVILCENSVKGEACGECPHCRQIEKGIHPDFFMLTPQEDSPAIKIEPLREMIARSYLRPLTARAKVFVIEPAETMNEITQNALLKTLEAPEGHSYFILISYAPNELIPTIRSRVQAFYFLPSRDFARLDEELLPYAEEVTAFLFPAQAERPVPDLTGLDRQQVLKVLDNAILFLRDVLLIEQGAGEALGNIENKYLKEKVSRSYSGEQLIQKIDILSDFKEKIASNVNMKLALSVLWTAII